VLVLAFVERTAWVEVVDTSQETVLETLALAFALSFMVVVSSDIREQVCWPAANLLVDQLGESGDRGVLGQLVELMSHFANPAAVVLACDRAKDHVSLDVAGSFVVLAVADFP